MAQKAAPVQKAPEPKPAPPAKLIAKAEATPTKGRAPVHKASPAEPPPAPKAPVAKATSESPAARAAEKAKPTVKATPSKKATVPGARPKPATKDRLPAKLLDEIAAGESEPVEETATTAEAPSIGSRPKRSPAAVSRRAPGKAKPPAAQERPNQLYLWIAAGQTDDLIAIVRTGLSRYQERFSHPAEVVLCHGGDLPALEGAKLPVDLREGKSLAPRNFWIGLK